MKYGSVDLLTSAGWRDRVESPSDLEALAKPSSREDQRQIQFLRANEISDAKDNLIRLRELLGLCKKVKRFYRETIFQFFPFVQQISLDNMPDPVKGNPLMFSYQYPPNEKESESEIGKRHGIYIDYPTSEAAREIRDKIDAHGTIDLNWANKNKLREGLYIKTIQTFKLEEAVAGSQRFVEEWSDNFRRPDWMKAEGEVEELVASAGERIVRAHSILIPLKVELDRDVRLLAQEMSSQQTNIIQLGENIYLIRYGAKNGQNYSVSFIPHKMIETLRSKIAGDLDISAEKIGTIEKENSPAKDCYIYHNHYLSDSVPNFDFNISSGRYKILSN